jgi:ABC-type transporter Mla subunit MlaD
MSNPAPLKNAAAPSPRAGNLADMLAVMSAQIDAALLESNAPAATLVETAHAMGQATQTIAKGLMDFSGSPARVFQDLMMLHDDMHARATKAATAIQFHDRLVQCLTHVSAALTMMSDFVADGRPKAADDWSTLRDRIRDLLSMEAERARFDTLSGTAEPGNGKSSSRAENDKSKVELF